jgi:hypothetical protein
LPDNDHEGWFFLDKNHDRADRFGPHQSRTALALPGGQSRQMMSCRKK